MYQNIEKRPDKIAPDNTILQDFGLKDLFKAVDVLSKYPTEKYDYYPLENDDDIKYRQSTFSDLHDKKVYDAFEKFVSNMMLSYHDREEIIHIDPLEYRQHVLVNLLSKEFETIKILLNELRDYKLHSTALINFLQYLQDYSESEEITKMKTDIKNIDKNFEDIYYRLYLSGRTVTVQASPEHKESLDDHFYRIFSPIFDEPKNMKKPVKMQNNNSSYNMNNLQTSIIKELAKLYPDQFSLLTDFYQKYQNYQEHIIENSVDELTFFIGWQKVQNIITDSLPVEFVIPELLSSGNEEVDDGFDFLMAVKKAQQAATGPIVTNQFKLATNKPFLVISGPNQGGKTTYARMAGQFYYLEKLGLAIPGSAARLKTKKQLYSHFDRQESSEKLSGLLEIDVERIHEIIEKVEPNSFVILNELFSSTSEEDATELGNRVLTELMEKGAAGIYVTFLESLGKHEKVQPLMSQVTDKAERTFKVIPQDLNGKAYTSLLLHNYHLSSSEIEGRVSK